METEHVEFVPLLNFETDYEIMKEYPFMIRNKRSGNIVSESFDKDGYVIVNLYSYPNKKHRLIAKQFIPNPNNLPHVDHINHNRSDNHIYNLRWISIRDNDKNRSSYKGIKYEFVDDLPEETIIVDFYETTKEIKEFEIDRYFYYFDTETNDDIFYGKITDNLYKILYINQNKSGNKFVVLTDKNNKGVSVYINKFKYQHALI